MIEDKNCKTGFSLNGNCIEVLQVNIKELNAGAKERANRKHDDVLEMEAKQLKDLQDTFKSFGVDYEKILSLVFSHYMKNATKFLERTGKAENVVMDFFENCNEQEFQNIEMLKFFLISDLGQVLVLIV